VFLLHSVDNARELGGYVLPDGRKVRRGLLLRGGSLAKASDEDIALLSQKYRVRRIFDFRTGMEVNKAPDKDIPGAEYVWMPAFDEETMHLEKLALPHEAYRNLGEWLLNHAGEREVQKIAREMYTGMVRNDFTQVQYAGFLQNIISTEGGAVLWHCSQGKDRTGLGAAFILFALGADRELVMKDYSLSALYYRNDLDKYLEGVTSEEEIAVLKTFISVNPDYFSAALDYIDAIFGSMENFLEGPLCLSRQDRETLKERYLED